MPGSNRIGLLALVAVLAAAGCTTRAVERDTSGMAAMGPVLSVERFLQAANARDFQAMAGLFGTADGPVEGPAPEVELRMATIAEILQHDDYRIVSERTAPGRTNPTNRVGVDITRDEGVIRDVPFLVVQTRGGNWLVEEIDLVKITSS